MTEGEKGLSPSFSLCSFHHIQANSFSSWTWKDPWQGIWLLQLWLRRAWRATLHKFAGDTETEGEQPMHWRAGLGFWRSCSGCSTGLAGTSQRSRMQMQTLHLGEDCPTHQYRLGYEQLGSSSEQKQPGDQAGQQGEQAPAMCPCSKEGQHHPGLPWQKCNQQVQKSDPPLLFRICETVSRVLCPEFWLPSAGKLQTCWVRPADSNEDGQSTLYERSWERWDCWAWRRGGSGSTLSSCTNTLGLALPWAKGLDKVISRGALQPQPFCDPAQGDVPQAKDLCLHYWFL